MADNSNGNTEAVNHPAHYQFPGGVETIDLAEQLNFNRGNIVKYASRAGRKATADKIDDLEKVIWYAKREIRRIRQEFDAAGDIAAAQEAAASPAPVPEQTAEEAEPEEAGVSPSMRQFLVRHFGELHPNLRPHWRGRPVNIAGWRNEYASLNTSAPGMWGVTWEDVSDVYLGRKTFDACSIWLVSNAWLGSEGGK